MAFPTGLDSYWKLDESSGNAADFVGSNTLTNANVTYGAGKINNAAVFNGSNATLTGTTYNSYPFTVSCWVKTSTTGNDAALIGNYVASSFNGWSLRIVSTGILFWAYVTGARYTSYTTPSNSISDGNWHHVVGVLDSSGASVYIDGTSIGTTAWTGTAGAPTTTNSLLSGLYASAYYTGSLDEVGVWPRALSGAEITDLYNSGAGLSPDTQNLTMVASLGSFTLTGTTTGLGRFYAMIASLGSFIMTGIDVILSSSVTSWISQSKNSATFASQSKNSATFTSQSKNSATFTSQSVNSSTWTAQNKTASVVIDSYGKTNTSGTYSLYNGYSVIYMGQSFTNTNVGYLDNIQFHIYKSGSPTGNATAYLYAHTGTLGSSSLATGTPLATSSTVIDVSTLGTTTAQAMSVFYFTGDDRYQLQANTNYCIVIGYNGGDVSNYLRLGTDITSPTPIGNIMYSANGTSWAAITANDLIYSVSSFPDSVFTSQSKN